jgi:surface polysaccharide O-acyltransferase-like enzyme
MQRLYYLDNLKVCLTVLVIMHHAGQAYGNGGGWAYTPSNPAEFMPWIWHFFSTNAAFFMGLYFFISGYFVPRSFDMQGAKLFVQKKLLRLGVPLLVMGAILSALSGKIVIGHMWFVESLLVFCLVYALIRQRVSPIDRIYICCAEGSLFMSPNTESITTPYLVKVRQAGAEYKETERISDDTQTYLDTPMLPAEAFVKTVNGIFEGMLRK